MTATDERPFAHDEAVDRRQRQILARINMARLLHNRFQCLADEQGLEIMRSERELTALQEGIAGRLMAGDGCLS